MRCVRCFGNWLLAALALAACSSEEQQPPSISAAFSAAVAGASLIFLGTVQQRGATTTRLVARSSLTSVVRIDSMLETPGTVGDIRGQRITVLVSDTAGLAVGGRYVFFAAGLTADSSLAVRELLRRRSENDAALIALVNEIDAERAAISARRFNAHYRDAAAVFVGAVRYIAPAQVAESIARVTLGERNPQWQRAGLVPTRMYRSDGIVAGQVVNVYVPGSTHLAFFGVPRPRTAQQALAILHRLTRVAPRARRGLDSIATYVMLDSLDLLPLADTMRIPP